jgi:hypothetical protein
MRRWNDGESFTSFLRSGILELHEPNGEQTLNRKRREHPRLCYQGGLQANERCRSLAIAQVGSEPFPSAIRILPEAAVVRSLIAAEAALLH